MRPGSGQRPKGIEREAAIAALAASAVNASVVLGCVMAASVSTPTLDVTSISRQATRPNTAISSAGCTITRLPASPALCPSPTADQSASGTGRRAVRPTASILVPGPINRQSAGRRLAPASPSNSRQERVHTNQGHVALGAAADAARSASFAL